MATTAQLRAAYPELVTNTKIPTCDYRQAVPVVFLAGGPFTSGRHIVRVHPKARQAFRVLAALFLWARYSFDEAAGGTVACRRITGGTGTSLHAHGICLDINPSRNGYRFAAGNLDAPDTGHVEGVLQWARYTDLPPHLVRAIEAVRTANGQKVWEWGGRWFNTKDPMHFELDTFPAALGSGINLATLPPGAWAAYLAFEAGTPLPPTDQEVEPMLKLGDAGAAVRKLQRAILRWNPSALPTFGADGDYGDETKKAVEAYQRASEIPRVTYGVADATTVAYLLDVNE